MLTGKNDTMIELRDFPEMMTVPDIQRALGIGRTKVYHMIHTGRLPVLHIGRLIRIPKPWLLTSIASAGERYVDCPEASGREA